jgi:curved DNA-binding protein CbpA
MKDYYKTLGIIQSTEPTVIKAVYKALMMIYHPDRNDSNKDEAIKMSKEINEAYAALSDPVTRKKYDSIYLINNGKTINLYGKENQTLQNKIVEYQIQLKKLVTNELALKHQINEQKIVIEELKKSANTLNNQLLNYQNILEQKKDYSLAFKEKKNTLIKIINDTEDILDLL